MIPDEIRNDPLVAEYMRGVDTRRSSREIVCAPTDSQWFDGIEYARWLDAYAVLRHGQRDRDHHLCCEQRSQQNRGFMMVEVSTNIYGYCVRDTINDGQGVIFGGRDRRGTTKADAIAWAKEWHAQRPTHRMVIMGYCGVKFD
jgi:hypothetical protein